MSAISDFEIEKGAPVGAPCTVVDDAEITRCEVASRNGTRILLVEDTNGRARFPMSTYCVTYRIADKKIGGKTYEERRQSVVDNTYTEGSGYWEETTSFILCESSLGTNDFAKKAAKGLSAKEDMLVAFDPSDMSVAIFGNVQHSDVLASFFRHADTV